MKKTDAEGKQFTLEQLDGMPTSNLVWLYNGLMPADKQIKKFSDRATALKRTWAVMLEVKEESVAKSVAKRVSPRYEIKIAKGSSTEATAASLRSPLRKKVFESLVEHGRLTVTELCQLLPSIEKSALVTALRNLVADDKAQSVKEVV
jgi:hypothetical protein